MHVERTIGDGTEAVYAFHYPPLNNMGPYWIKIGKAKDPLKRLKSLQAAMPEKASVDLIIRTDNATFLERFIHTELASVRKAGSEWFLTTPEDVEAAWLRAGDFYHMEIGEQVRWLRNQKGMSQQQLADSADVRQATLSKIETCGDVMLSTLQDVANELGMRVSLLP